MDEFKLRAGEKLEALQSAAKAAADGSKTKVQDVASQTTELIRKIREAFQELWQNDLIVEGRERVAAWSRDAVQRIRDGTPPLSPVLLYEELVALFKDRMWRRSVALFLAGAALGGGAGLLLGLRAAARPPAGPHARALLAQPDRAVLLVDDAVTPGAGAAALRSLAARSPISVGRGFAGVVLDAGAGVPLELGDEVWGCLSEWSGGTASELLTVRSSRVSRRPRGLAADAAAALPWAGSLALAALDRAPYADDAWKGKRVAIIGATSGEGLALLQLLSRKGAKTTTAAPKGHQSTMHEFGASQFIEMGAGEGGGWGAVEAAARLQGPWDALLCCEAAGVPCSPPPSLAALLKSTAPRGAFLDLRGGALMTDRLPTPFWLLFCASFYTYRTLRWAVGLGAHADWLERPQQLTAGLERLAGLVDSGLLMPALDKVYFPQEFEAALAHACSEDALGTTVIRFP
ncbi:unnamed protein product, partial [Iphiclides podalirius]